MAVSSDPVKGNDQKSDDFWTQVQEKFLLFGYKIPHYHSRSHSGLKSRFKTTIQPKCSKFLSIYKSVKATEKSGYNEDDYVEEAMENY